ncbi:MAG: NUDIX hydrolase [Polyangia bacterium]
MPVPITPLCTVDCIIDLVDHPLHRADRPVLVLIERRYPPHGWALPGGFVDVGEPVSQAAIREALEETSLHIELTEQFFTYSSPSRDPRKHTVSTVFLATAKGQPTAADDAGRVAVFTEDNLPELAFDHGQILADFFAYRRSGQRPGPHR